MISFKEYSHAPIG